MWEIHTHGDSLFSEGWLCGVHLQDRQLGLQGGCFVQEAKGRELVVQLGGTLGSWFAGSSEKDWRRNRSRNVSPGQTRQPLYPAHRLLIYFFFFFKLEKSYIAVVFRQQWKIKRKTNPLILLPRESYHCHFAIFDPSMNALSPYSLPAQMSPAQCHWVTP